MSSLVNTPYDPARLKVGDVRAWKLRSVQAADAATARLVDHFHAVSQGVAEANVRALHLRPERITVVERGRSRAGSRDLERRPAMQVRERLGIVADAKVVLAVGRQEHQKRHVDLIAAADAMVDRVAGLRVLIAGPAGQRDAGAAAGALGASACRHDHFGARPPSRRPRSAVRRRCARHPVALRGDRGSGHRGDGAEMPRRVHRRRGCSRHPEQMGSMPCWCRPASRRASPTDWSERCTTISWSTRCVAVASPTSRSASRSKRRRPGWRSCTPRSPEAARRDAGDEAARAGPRVAPRRGGLIEAHRRASACPRLPPHR